MKTLADAERAISLGRERYDLMKSTESILEAPWIFLVAGKHENTVSWSYIDHPSVMSHVRFEVFTEKARQLLIEVVQARVAKIDEELRALGIEPDAPPRKREVS